MWWFSRPRILLTTAMLLLLAGCSSGTAGPRTVSGDRVIYNPEPRHGPYVVVAVDDHFHDIHPIDRVHISENRPFIVKNEGRNLHNFTVVGAGISVDIRPGHELAWVRLGAHLNPGFYQVICTYHLYVGMRGLFYVTK